MASLVIQGGAFWISKMKRRQLLIFLLLGLLYTVDAYSQRPIAGIPKIVNYNKFAYKAGPQNWMITHAPNGFVYVANNDGLLEFDGSDWKVYRDLGVVNRAVLYNQGRIYVGGYNEFGYYSPNENGVLVYTTLSKGVKRVFRFGEIWKIHELDGVIYFQSNEAIFTYSKNHIKIMKAPARFDFAYIANRTLFVNDAVKGLLIYRRGELVSIDPERKVATKQLSGVSELDKGRVLISTIDKGLFIYDGIRITSWDIPISPLLKKYQINTEAKVNGYHIFGTILNGLYIIDAKGKMVLEVNQNKGLNNNNVICVGTDLESNIWLGLNNGLAKLELNTSLSYIGNSFKIESVYATALWNGKLYIGTNSGLFQIDWSRFLDPMKNDSDFKLIPGSEGQVWNLTVIGGTLFCGHNNGVYTVSASGLTSIGGIRGGWLFLPIKDNPNKVIVANYTGLALIEKRGSSWAFVNELKGFTESSRFVEQDSEGDYWVSHGYKGIYRLKVNENYTGYKSIEFFGKHSGLPSDKNNMVAKIGGRLVFTTENGIYSFNPQTKTFSRNEELNRTIRSNGWISYLKQDEKGNIWCVHGYKTAVLRLQEDRSYTTIATPFYPLTRRNIITFEHFYSLPNGMTLIGSEEGMAIYDPAISRPENSPYKVFIKDITKGDVHYSLSFADNVNPEFKQGKSPIMMSASAPFKNSGASLYSFKLDGFDKDWSPWSENNHKEYTNLSEGTYTISVRAKSYGGEVSPMVSKVIQITPPWHRSSIAYLIYIVIFIGLSVRLKRLYDRNIEKSRKRGEHQQREQFKAREAQLVKEALQAENEMIRIKNENLQDVMRRKERELTLSTMHVIQKNELISKMKAELRKLQGATSDRTIKEKTADIIKKMAKDADNKSEWKTFELHFEQVHEEFIRRLKDRFPDLTSRELRLCVYLKMNLSSKEIANLMNISPRGVEISRYRIRKKMNLERNEGLSEILMEI